MKEIRIRQNYMLKNKQVGNGNNANHSRSYSSLEEEDDHEVTDSISEVDKIGI